MIFLYQTFGLLLDMRLHPDLMASAAEHAHCNTTVESALIAPEGKAMMSHVKIVDP